MRIYFFLFITKNAGYLLLSTTLNKLKLSSIDFLISNLLSIGDLFLLVVGSYLISKGVGDKPEIDPYAVQSYDEEE